MKVNYAHKQLLTFTRPLFTTPDFLTSRARLDVLKSSKYANGKGTSYLFLPFMSRDLHNIRFSRLIIQTKVTFTLLQAMKAQTGGSGKALLFL